MVHDTVLFSNKLLSKLPLNEEFEYRPLTAESNRPSMNMGIFSQQYLESKSDVINQYTTWGDTTEELHNLKAYITTTEDILMPDKEQALNKTPRRYFGIVDFYRTGSPRLTEFYPDIALVKLKSNWKSHPETFSIDI